MSRIDDAVSRILTKKFELGLFEHPFTDRRRHRPGRLAGAPRGRPPGGRRVPGAAQEQPARAADPWPPRRLRRRQQRRQHRQPGRRLDADLAGRLDQRDPRHDDPRRDPPSGSAATSPTARTPRRRSAANDVGIVVVGETPYAEGFGDVGGPQWAYDPGDNGVPRPVKDMQLSAADKAAVDKVCAAAKKCVVVVVSGRPLILDPEQLSKIDGLVAAWLPGQRGRRRGRHAVRQAPVHGQAAGHVAADARAGADQRRRRELRPAVSVRVRAEDAGGGGWGGPGEAAGGAGGGGGGRGEPAEAGGVVNGGSRGGGRGGGEGRGGRARRSGGPWPWRWGGRRRRGGGARGGGGGGGGRGGGGGGGGGRGGGGGGIRELLGPSVHAGAGVFSPTGDRYAYQGIGRDIVDRVFVAHLLGSGAGTQEELLSDSRHRGFRISDWSPDATRVLYYFEDDFGGREDVPPEHRLNFVRTDVPGGGSIPILVPRAFAPFAGGSFFPDSRTIAFAATTPLLGGGFGFLVRANSDDARDLSPIPTDLKLDGIDGVPARSRRLARRNEDRLLARSDPALPRRRGRPRVARRDQRRRLGPPGAHARPSRHAPAVVARRADAHLPAPDPAHA